MHEFIMKALDFLVGLGYPGIALALMIEVIPSEIVLGFTGFMVGKGEFNFALAVIAGTIGGVVAQLFLYWLGYYGGRPAVLKYGKYILIKEKHVKMAEEWFEKYGTGVVLSARFIPVVRHAISIPAGLAKMNFWRFTILTTVAIIPWSILFIYMGMQLGANWEHVKEKSGTYITLFLVLAVVFFIVYFLIKRRSKN